MLRQTLLRRYVDRWDRADAARVGRLRLKLGELYWRLVIRRLDRT